MAGTLAEQQAYGLGGGANRYNQGSSQQFTPPGPSRYGRGGLGMISPYTKEVKPAGYNQMIKGAGGYDAYRQKYDNFMSPMGFDRNQVNNQLDNVMNRWNSAPINWNNPWARAQFSSRMMNRNLNALKAGNPISARTGMPTNPNKPVALGSAHPYAR